MTTTVKERTRIVDGAALPATGIYDFDPGHTTVAFEGRHLVITRVRGRFLEFSGALHVAERPEASFAELAIRADSLVSGLKDRDDHLRSPDFLDTPRYPMITFRSTSIVHVTGDHWRATGDLSIRGVTRPIDVVIEFDGAVLDPWGNEKIGFSVHGDFNREDFGLTWNMLMEGGGLVASKRIQVDIDVEATRRSG